MTATQKQLEYYTSLRDIITDIGDSGDSARQPDKRRAEAAMNTLIRDCPTIILDWSAALYARSGY